MKDSDVISVMSFNLRYASAKDGLNDWHNPGQSPDRREVTAQVISKWAPDLIGLQEGEDDQIAFLASRLPGYMFEKRKPSGGQGEENLAFAFNGDKLRLIDTGVFSLGPKPGDGWFKNPPGMPFDPYDFFPGMKLRCPRLALWGHFQWRATGYDFLFYTTHFDFDSDVQVRSAQMIVEDAIGRSARLPHPLAIITGDFNAGPDSATWNAFADDFKDCELRTGTFHEFKGGTLPESQQIDWILHSGGITTESVSLVPDALPAKNESSGEARLQYPSDHYPVRARLRFPPVSSE